MRKQFPGYYRPAPEECAAKFKECLFSFDTNSLLNLYRYAPEASADLLKALQAVKDRVWLTNQVAYEYHDNRVEVILGQRGLYGDLKDAIDKSIKAIDEYRRSASHLVTNLIEPVRKALEEVKASLDKKKEEHPDLLKSDPILDALTDLFEGKVGDPYEPDEYKKRLAAAKQRFEARVPPGFLDSMGRKKKEGDRKYGDMLVWFQLLDHAKKDRKPLVFVTDETGVDWWQKDDRKVLGPRPELLQEMHKEANGKWFYMYSTEQFLEHSKALLAVDVKPEVIKEVKKVRREDERAASAEARLETLRELQRLEFANYAARLSSLGEAARVTRPLVEIPQPPRSELYRLAQERAAHARQYGDLLRRAREADALVRGPYNEALQRAREAEARLRGPFNDAIRAAQLAESIQSRAVADALRAAQAREQEMRRLMGEQTASGPEEGGNATAGPE